MRSPHSLPTRRPTPTSGWSIGCWPRPHYGERWGRHWLDVAGYADSEGYDDQDRRRPEAFRYRDYVIRAFNTDKPFDQFVIEQLAGDELVPQPHKNLPLEAIEKLTATGFLRMAADGTATAGAALADRQQPGRWPTRSRSSPLRSWDFRSAVPSATTTVTIRSCRTITTACGPCSSRPSTGRTGASPTQRRVSLYTDADRARVAASAAEINKAAAAYAEKEQKYIARALDKELPPSSSRRCAKQLKAAFDTPAAKRTAEQKSLLSRYPSVNISPGTLYQYDQPAADELKQDAAKIAGDSGPRARASSSSAC